MKSPKRKGLSFIFVLWCCFVVVVLHFILSDSWFAKLEKHDEILMSVHLWTWGKKYEY